jgi:hypothetical protein
MEKGETGQFDQLVATEQAVHTAQVAAKVIQIRALKDLLNHLSVSQDLDEQKK